MFHPSYPRHEWQLLPPCRTGVYSDTVHMSSINKCKLEGSMDSCSIEAGEYHRHHTFWGLQSLERARRVSSGASVRHRPRYAVRELRYWFMDHLIRREYAVQKRPLTICEAGVGSGGLLKFVNGVAVENEENKLPSWIVSWDGVSRRVDPAALRGIATLGALNAISKNPNLSCIRYMT